MLDDAVSRLREALRLSAARNPLLPVLLALLGSILRKRFIHLQIPTDLAASEGLAQDAVRMLESHESYHQSLPQSRAMYGETMLAKFEQDPQEEYLNKAISLFQLVLKERRDLDEDHTDAYFRYGNALLVRNKGDDITSAIEHLRRTLLIQPDKRHSRYPVWATSLSAALLAEFNWSGELAKLNEALSTSETAASIVSDTSTSRATVYAQLGEVKYRVFELYHRPEDLEACLLAFQTVAMSDSSPRPQCSKFTRRWEDLATNHSHGSLWEAIEDSLTHQAQMANIGRSIKARHEYLARNLTPATRAAARATRKGQHERAIEYLEQGRSIVWRQTLELRSSLETLSLVSPSLANQLAAVVAELDDNAEIQFVSAKVSTAWTVDDPDRVLRYNRELARHYESLITQIRQLDGFSDFLRPFQFSDTSGVSSDGPIVIVNLCDEGCDALVLLDSGVHHVPLACADFEDLTATRAELATAVARVEYDGGAEMEHLLPSALRLLWSSIAEPIVEFFKSQGPVPKRVFWCLTGMSELPIHAAGPYRARSYNMPDILVSSYIPTISSLIMAQKAKAKASPSRPRILAVAQTKTAGFSPLPFAVSEISALGALCPETTELADEQAIPKSVLSELQTQLGAFMLPRYNRPTNPTVERISFLRTSP